METPCNVVYILDGKRITEEQTIVAIEWFDSEQGVISAIRNSIELEHGGRATFIGAYFDSDGVSFGSGE